jgi:mannose-6-phosphate isomerase-like protein (cupin superfamily)
MPWHRVINVLELEKVVWDNWPDFGANQFMSQGPDRLRTETQNRLPTHGATPARHAHQHADTVHIILEGEGEYTIAPDVWVPARPGDIFLSRGGEVHGGRGTNPDAPLKYLVIEGPAPETLQLLDDRTLDLNWGLDDVRSGEPQRVGYNGGIGGTNVLLGGPTDRPKWMDHLPEGSYTD